MPEDILAFFQPWLFPLKETYKTVISSESVYLDNSNDIKECAFFLWKKKMVENIKFEQVHFIIYWQDFY